MKITMKFLRSVIPLLLLGLIVSPARSADEMEKQLLKEAPKILAELKAKGFKNVGVLKFRVKKGNEPATDRAGTLNFRLAEKLELALVLANKIQDPVGIIRNASKTAATIPGANHLTEEGRQKLFTKEYPLAWGETNVTPDAFITGVAVISADLRSMTVGAATFDKTGKELTALAKFDMKPDLEDLLDSGESFTVRGVFDKASLSLTEEERKEKATTEAVAASVQVKAETETQAKPVVSKIHPLSIDNPDSPITFEVLYDNKPQKIEFRSGAAFVEEPNEKQTVVFVVRRKGTDRSRLGVVVKVNGENTLYRQKQADAQCSPWVFEKDSDAFGIYGFQLDNNTSQQFKVLSQAESKGKEIDYGEFVGTISVSVFREQTVTPKVSPSALADDGEDFAILTRSAFPTKTPANLGALKAQLAQSATRGLIVEGANVDLNVKTVGFKMDTVPVITGTLRYYHQQDLPK